MLEGAGIRREPVSPRSGAADGDARGGEGEDDRCQVCGLEEDVESDGEEGASGDDGERVMVTEREGEGVERIRRFGTNGRFEIWWIPGGPRIGKWRSMKCITCPIEFGVGCV